MLITFQILKMKKIFLVALNFILIFSYSIAQDAEIQNLKSEATKAIVKNLADTIPKKWKTTGLISLNISQGSLSNWSAGGDRFSLSLNSYINGHASYIKDKIIWENNLDIYLGYIKTTSLGPRKNDDRIDFVSKYGYGISSKLSISALLNFRSQFFNGYNYSDPSKMQLSSSAFAPAYILLSPGINWQSAKNFSVFVSPVTSRFVIVTKDSLKAQYNISLNKSSEYEFGSFASINFTTAINEHLNYTGRLDLFSNYKHHPKNVDVYMTNLFSSKISKVLSATWSLDMIYDDDVHLFGPEKNKAALQLKSLFGAGLLV